MKIVIVGHKNRLEYVDALVAAFGGIAMAVIDHSNRGALWGHREALKLAHETGERCIIMEDDAVPVVDFVERAQAWLDRCPRDLVSFYLGTGRPVQWQSWVTDAIKTAKGDNVCIPRLLHGVCYSIPADAVPKVIRRMRPAAADESVAAAWGRPVVYPIHSLVEHRDGPSVEVHPDGQPRVEARKARFLANDLMEI